MIDSPHLHDAVDWLKNLSGALMPAAIGSAVAQAYQGSLGWRERLVQWFVGITVSYYATLLIAALALDVLNVKIGPAVNQGLGFVFGTLAFNATPKFIAAAGDAIAALPTGLKDWVLAWLPHRKGPAA